MMPKAPKISTTLMKKHAGEVAIWKGKIIGIGKDAVIALKEEKSIMPSIEQKEFLVSRIPHKHIAV